MKVIYPVNEVFFLYVEGNTYFNFCENCYNYYFGLIFVK